MIVLRVVLLDLRFCFMNYDSVFTSYDSVFHDKNVLFMQQKLRLLAELNKRFFSSPSYVNYYATGHIYRYNYMPLLFYSFVDKMV